MQNLSSAKSTRDLISVIVESVLMMASSSIFGYSVTLAKLDAFTRK